MNNITNFELNSDFEVAYEGETLAYPNTSFIKDTATLYFLSSYVPKNYMYVEALEDGLSVQFNQLMSASANSLEYSTDQKVWKTTTNGVSTDTINAGEKLYFRGDVTNMDTSFDIDNIGGIGTFIFDKKCNVGGNVMSLLFNDNFEDKYDLSEYDGIFAALFADMNQTGMLIHADKLILPAKILSQCCYSYMFTFCTSLTTAPELPATELVERCYYQMFAGCTALTTAPELPATTLVKECYYKMFSECTSLTTAPQLPATELIEHCYEEMFEGCTSLTTAPKLPATTLAYSCYYRMFNGCTSLTTAPELPATTLVSNCYSSMFLDCTSLTSAPQLPATILASSCYYSMFSGCTALTTTPQLHATTLAGSCYERMFYGCTALTTAPQLPATTLADSCYNYMFYSCTKLNNITMLATDISATNCLYNCVYGVASTGTFTKHPSMTSLPTGVSGIPEGWTVVDYAA